MFQKKEWLSLRLSQNEKTTLEILAARHSRSKSDMTRELIREAGVREGLPPAGLIEFEKYLGGGK